MNDSLHLMPLDNRHEIAQISNIATFHDHGIRNVRNVFVRRGEIEQDRLDSRGQKASRHMCTDQASTARHQDCV
jgi:hypothetical protein